MNINDNTRGTLYCHVPNSTVRSHWSQLLLCFDLCLGVNVIQVQRREDLLRIHSLSSRGQLLFRLEDCGSQQVEGIQFISKHF